MHRPQPVGKPPQVDFLIHSMQRELKLGPKDKILCEYLFLVCLYCLARKCSFADIDAAVLHNLLKRLYSHRVLHRQAGLEQSREDKHNLGETQKTPKFRQMRKTIFTYVKKRDFVELGIRSPLCRLRARPCGKSGQLLAEIDLLAAEDYW